ncbi:hypothetical protein GT037_010754 [Alternaria burnsii]|jgi:hypothetical protein|uniref:Uncharacterized protein n=2 Tax=Alternaria sect. Alternaria TaxID=2499237 RepID=A0A8H7EAX6_9PLEO|nr:uncharacterized protein GT037_010754 [Alternaria burnsii]KAF7671193.1 hypothetical protein GT037_010754 [Alternaria burnsii]RYN17288.1 hypothetical protein AA0115_g11903 [Alternaria tenuissima]
MQLTPIFVSLFVAMTFASPVPDPQVTRPNCRLARSADADPQITRPNCPLPRDAGPDPIVRGKDPGGRGGSAF